MPTIINADTSDGLKFTSDTSGEIKLQSAGADIATVDSSGITLATGKDLTLSSTALDASASGIYLGGTASANLLDDYEEGTFTPSFTNFNIGNGTYYGYYTKIGNLVTINCGFIYGSTSSFSGSIIGGTGLPFASKNTATGVFYPLIGKIFNSGSGWIQLDSGVSNNTSAFTYPYSGTVLINATSPMTWATGDTFNLGGVYYTDS